ncbi:hypothetical protein Pelo_9303 [Pelomyxa schiedti]|nr:hypothetical protein Pelo_9303 [Pelomyxa schiedti]
MTAFRYVDYFIPDDMGVWWRDGERRDGCVTVRWQFHIYYYKVKLEKEKARKDATSCQKYRKSCQEMTPHTADQHSVAIPAAFQQCTLVLAAIAPPPTDLAVPFHLSNCIFPTSMGRYSDVGSWAQLGFWPVAGITQLTLSYDFWPRIFRHSHMESISTLRDQLAGECLHYCKLFAAPRRNVLCVAQVSPPMFLRVPAQELALTVALTVMNWHSRCALTSRLAAGSAAVACLAWHHHLGSMTPSSNTAEFLGTRIHQNHGITCRHPKGTVPQLCALWGTSAPQAARAQLARRDQIDRVLCRVLQRVDQICAASITLVIIESTAYILRKATNDCHVLISSCYYVWMVAQQHKILSSLPPIKVCNLVVVASSQDFSQIRVMIYRQGFQDHPSINNSTPHTHEGMGAFPYPPAHAPAVLRAVVELALVRVSVGPGVHAAAVHLAVPPLAVVRAAVWPGVGAAAVALVVDEAPCVRTVRRRFVVVHDHRHCPDARIRHRTRRKGL